MKMLSKLFILSMVLTIDLASSFQIPHHARLYRTQIFSSEAASNVDMFSAPPSSPKEESSPSAVIAQSSSVVGRSQQADKFKDKAARLRQEAAEMEMQLREEARAKGLSEEMINKLVPITRPGTSQPMAKNEKKKEEEKRYTNTEIRSKLGYLLVGDAVRLTQELDRIKGRGFLKLWNSKDLSKSSYSVSEGQLTSKTKIDAVTLKLDDVGYNYQAVFGIALASATVFALGASQIGGELGFILGYLSALAPIGLVGIGSIAPGLLGDAVNKYRYITDPEARDRCVAINAAKFLTGYVLGLPFSSFTTSGVSNVADFFQVRPGEKSDLEAKLMFAKSKFKQSDIARSSVVCLSGNVGECLLYGQASGSNPNDVNTLYELVNSVSEPALPTDKAQAHIRWAAMTAYEILSTHKDEYEALREAFRSNTPIEECISILESVEKKPKNTEDGKMMMKDDFSPVEDK